MSGAFQDPVPAKEATSEWNREDAVLYKTSRKESMQDTSNILQDKQTYQCRFRQWQCTTKGWFCDCFFASASGTIAHPGDSSWNAYAEKQETASWKLGFHSNNGQWEWSNHQTQVFTLVEFETHLRSSFVSYLKITFQLDQWRLSSEEWRGKVHTIEFLRR